MERGASSEAASIPAGKGAILPARKRPPASGAGPGAEHSVLTVLDLLLALPSLTICPSAPLMVTGTTSHAASALYSALYEFCVSFMAAVALPVPLTTRMTVSRVRFWYRLRLPVVTGAEGGSAETTAETSVLSPNSSRPLAGVADKLVREAVAWICTLPGRCTEPEAAAVARTPA